MDHHDTHHGHEASGISMGDDPSYQNMSTGHPMMYFTFDWKGTYLLFESWLINSESHLIWTCLCLFVVSIVYEAFRSFRELVYDRLTKKRMCELSVNTMSSPTESGIQYSHRSDNSILVKNDHRYLDQILNWPHLTQSFLHILQVSLSYILMLAFMTYNVYFCASILLGAGVGYFFFCYRRITIIDVNQSCH